MKAMILRPLLSKLSSKLKVPDFDIDSIVSDKKSLELTRYSGYSEIAEDNWEEFQKFSIENNS